MSKVIDFLERMGQDARLRAAPLEEMELALEQAQIGPEARAVILAGDQQRLDALLEGLNVCLALCPAEEEEDGGAEEVPSREDDEETASKSLSHVVA